jgi:hypothetical protein
MLSGSSTRTRSPFFNNRPGQPLIARIKIELGQGRVHTLFEDRCLAESLPFQPSTSRTSEILHGLISAQARRLDPVWKSEVSETARICRKP